MNKESLKRKVLSDMNMKENMISDLQRELEEEMKKPAEKWDCRKISEITETIHQFSCGHETDMTGKKKLIEKVRGEKVPDKKKIYRRIAAAAACLLIVIGINTASLSVFGMNMFSAVYQISKGDITIDLNERNVIELPVSADDPYGMKAKCAEYNMKPLTPTYIPEGFELADIAVDEISSFTDVIFYYKKSGIKLNFDFCQYKEREEIPPIGIPTDTYNISEEVVNGRKMYILKEDNQFTAAFLEDNIVYLITAIDCNYDECQKVIESLTK